MDMPVDSRKIVKDAKDDSGKERFTVTISPDTLAEFKKRCDKEKTSYSAIVQKLMVEFINGFS